MKFHLWGCLGGRGALVHMSHVHGNALSHMNESYCSYDMTGGGVGILGVGSSNDHWGGGDLVRGCDSGESKSGCGLSRAKPLVVQAGLTC